MILVLEADRRLLELAEALDIDLLVAVDQYVGDRIVLEQRLDRAEAEHLVQHVVDQLLALRMVEGVALLVELLEDDVADLLLDLSSRHFLERRQVDEAEQPLVKLDLQFGVQVIGSEGAGIADGHQPPFLLGPLGGLFGRCLVLGLAYLPHDQCSSPRAAARP